MKQYGSPLATLVLTLVGTVGAGAVELQPHEAVYDLALVSQTSDFNDVDGRIALQLKPDACKGLTLDYRFMARFHEDSELTVTDQQTLAKESRDGKRYDFRTRTLVDGTEQGVVEGYALNDATATKVTFASPVERQTELPLSVFPLGHTANLIEKALSGQRIVQSTLFDGDDDADKHLTTTALLLPAKPDALPTDPAVAASLKGQRSWNVTESYFNSDSDGDGLPIFETRYRLYENGVSDELRLDFGDYTLEGGLARLEYFDRPANCPPAP